MDTTQRSLRAEIRALIDRLDEQQLGMAVEFLSRLAGGHNRDWGPLGTILGIEDAGRTAGVSACSLSLRDIHVNPMGLGHGCVSFALADFGMGYALKTAVSPEQWSASQEVTIRFLRPARRTRLACHSRVVEIDGDAARVEAEVFNASRQIVAEARGTYRIFESARRSYRPPLESKASTDGAPNASQ